MSQRQATPIHTTNGAHGPPQFSPKKKPQLPPIKPYSPTQVQLQNDRRPELQSPATNPSPRDRIASSSTFPEPRSAFKMQSILNPTGANDETLSQRSSIPPESYTHRSTSESPASSNGPLTPGRTFPPMGGLPSPHLAGNRHGFHTAGLASRGPHGSSISAPTATIDAKKSPFLSNPTKGAYPQIELAQGRSTTPTGGRPGYPFPQQNLLKSEDRRGSETSQIIPSQSNSPTTSLTSYGTGPGTGSRTSPVLSYSQCAPGTSEHLKQMNSAASTPGGFGPSAGYSGPQNGSNQNTYQIMTIDTDKGPVQLPVDVQAASKVADEKRKRNAGASARFRQRRKEKERESSQSIARLESKVRELADEKDFYRAERDYFRKLVYNSPVQSQVGPRPISPRQRRTSVDTSSTGTPEWQQNGERGSDDGRNQRRRISAYLEGGSGQGHPPPPAQGPPPTSHNPHAPYPPQQPGYGYSVDARSRAAHSPHDRPPMSGQPPLPGPPPLRNGPYEGGLPQGYERGYYAPSRP